MSQDIYYCPKNPTEHDMFECVVDLRSYWLVDKDGDYVKELHSEINEMDFFECRECNTPANYGPIPSALEMLALEAD